MSKELESLTTNTAVRKTGVHKILNTADKIHALYEGIAQGLRSTVYDAIQIGELLTQEKKKLAHGEFEKWFIESEFPFTDRMGRTYMRLYRKREQVARELEGNQKLGLKDIVRLLSESGDGSERTVSPGSLFLRLQSEGVRSLTRPEREQVKIYLKSTLDRIDERRKELKGYYDKL